MKKNKLDELFQESKEIVECGCNDEYSDIASNVIANVDTDYSDYSDVDYSDGDIADSEIDDNDEDPLVELALDTVDILAEYLIGRGFEEDEDDGQFYDNNLVFDYSIETDENVKLVVYLYKDGNEVYTNTLDMSEIFDVNVVINDISNHMV